jgi:hypothetical protein
MKGITYNKEASPHKAQDAQQAASAGPEAMTIAPPAYGIGSSDRDSAGGNGLVFLDNRPESSSQQVLQRMMLRPRQRNVAAVVGVPPGYMDLKAFDKATSYNYDLSSRVGNPGGIYAKLYKKKVFLWWQAPAAQVDDYVYFGNRDEDIKDLQANHQDLKGYTWHHTGYPHEESAGTMQLVPTDEHEALPHVGGVAISQGKI